MNTFNLSAAHVAYGNDVNRSPWRWLASPGTMRLLAALELTQASFTTKTGRGGGTWGPRAAMLGV